MAREYDNVADAISAVNDEVSDQATKIADILAALEDKAGGGMSLLGSGVYNKASSSANLTCPVSYSGTPKLVYIVNTTPPVDTAQLIFAARWLEFADDDITAYSSDGFAAYRLRNSSNTLSWIAQGPNSMTLSEDTLSISRPSATANSQAGEWHWYIYGEAEA